MREQTRGGKERRCSESDGNDDEREARERSDETKIETRQGKTYEEEPNKSISSYMSEEINGSGTTCMARPDRYRGTRY